MIDQQLLVGKNVSLLSKILSLHLHLSIIFTVTTFHEYLWRFYNGHYSFMHNLSTLIPLVVTSSMSALLSVVIFNINKQGR